MRLPSVDDPGWTVWDGADDWSALTGIKVWGIQELEPGGIEGFDTSLLAEVGEQLNVEDFLSGQIKPSGVVVLFSDYSNVATLWELSPKHSALWISCGADPGAAASGRIQ